METVKKFLVFALVFVVIVVMMNVTVSTVYSNSEQIDSVTLSDSNTYLATSNYKVLDPVGEGITSLSATSPNQTWLNFDGVNDYINISNLNYNLTNGFTVSMFVYPTQADADQTFFDTYRGTTFDNRIQIGQHNTGSGVWRVTLRALNNASTFNLYSTTGVDNTKWHHIAVVFNKSNISLYVDGVRDSKFINVTGYFDLSLNNNAIIGATRAYGNYFNGSIDEVNFFNYTLDYSEIKALSKNRNNIKTRLEFINLSKKGTPALNRSGAIYAAVGVKIFKSIDDGINYEQICDNCSDEDGIFVDSRNTVFSSFNNTLTMSFGNDTNFTRILNYSCNLQKTNITFRYNAMDEDSLGNLYLGQYSTGALANETTCAYIYKSSNGGLTWSLSFNASTTNGDGKHIHMVQVDPYTDYIYAAVGDATVPLNANASKLIRSRDHGLTWDILGTGDQMWQFTVITFTEGYRFLGTDDTVGENKIIKTADDSSFDTAFYLPQDENDYFHGASTDLNGNIFFTTNTVLSRNATMYMSKDNGNSWYQMINLGAPAISNTGLSVLTKFNSNNYAYVLDTINNRLIKFTTSDNKTKMFYKLSENSGTTAYDSSGNSNNGTISGATWQTDGTTKTLVEGVDFNHSSNRINILNGEHLYSLITVSYSYDSETSSGSRDASILRIVGILAIIGVLVFAYKYIEENVGVFR